MKIQEYHPNWYYPIHDMRTLILGTYPPHEEQRDYEFYYPNNVNHFWRVLAEIAKKPLIHNEKQPAVEERQQLMKSLRIGVQNLGLRILRENKSALDRDIEILDYQDLLGIIYGHDTLQNILLPGYSDRTSTYKSFVKYLKKEGISHTKPKIVKAGNKFVIHCKRPIECILANSTSPTAQRGGITFDMLVRQFSGVIIE